MPIASLDALRIHREIRAYFKGQFKSGNKGYPLTRGGADLEPGSKTPAARLARERKRAAGQGLLMELQGSYTDILEQGVRVLNQSSRGRVGNCTEMAYAAAYLARCYGTGVPWIGCIGKPGDHVFCILGTATAPNFTRVQDMFLDYRGAWVIDPWANTCCLLRDYAQQFIQRMNKWTAEGKRIWDYDKESWVTPSSPAYLNGFLSGPLRYRPVPRLMHRAIAIRPPVDPDQHVIDIYLPFD